MLESKIEKELLHKVKNIGGLAWKFTSPGTRGVPDRIVIFKNKIAFVELKSPGEKPRPLQLKRHRQLRDMGHEVYVIDTIQGVQDFIEEVMPK